MATGNTNDNDDVRPECDRRNHAKPANGTGTATETKHTVEPDPDNDARGQRRAGHVADRAKREGHAEIEGRQSVQILQHEGGARNPGEQARIARRGNAEIGEIGRIAHDNAIGAAHGRY